MFERSLTEPDTSPFQYYYIKPDLQKGTVRRLELLVNFFFFFFFSSTLNDVRTNFRITGAEKMGLHFNLFIYFYFYFFFLTP